MEMVRVKYFGRVQNVGFRATVMDLAEAHGLPGRVCNNGDGTVTMQAAGDPSELQRFLNAISVRFSRNIIRQHDDWRSLQVSPWIDFQVTGDDSLK